MRDIPDIGETPLLDVALRIGGAERRIALKLEGANPGGSIKDRTALSLVESLRARGALGPRSVLIESTSGNLGVGLALVAAAYGYPLVAVVDPKTSEAHLRKIESLGASVDVVDTPDAHGNFLEARLARVRERLEASSRFVWPDQYSNPANPAAHRLGTGPEILRQTGGRIDVLVAAASTGGTLAGLAAFFARAKPDVRIVAVDTPGSAALGGRPGRRHLTGIGSSRRSVFLTPPKAHEVIAIGDAEAFSQCHELSRIGVLVGGSSGAVVAACARYIADHDEATAPVCVCADTGANYRETIFEPGWLRRRGIRLQPPAATSCGRSSPVELGL